MISPCGQSGEGPGLENRAIFLVIFAGLMESLKLVDRIDSLDVPLERAMA
jgi:hypothetical protein